MKSYQRQILFDSSQEGAEGYGNILRYQQEMLFLISMGNLYGALECYQRIRQALPISDYSLAGSEQYDRIVCGISLLSVVTHRLYIMNMPVTQLSYIYLVTLDSYLRHETPEEYDIVSRALLKFACDLVNTKNGRSSLVRHACQHINENLFSWYTEPQIAEIVGCSVGRLNALFEQEVGCTAYKYMIRRKLKLACLFLLETKRSVSELAHIFAFCSSSHFSKVFHQYIGMTPTEYRKKGAIFGTNSLLPDW